MTKQTRQLAAIMFTDIQGYTALMQKDEKQAIEIRKKHREVFNSQTERFHGKILQYFGDGTLSIFDSAIDAVNCGIEMQLDFQKQLNIPVRIGIHTGDILFSEDEIIGDGVNVASRIESISVPGSVFVSGKVYDEIKNHSAIQTQSLRSFTFKNVEKPIEVYAISNQGLVIPELSKLNADVQKNDPVQNILGSNIKTTKPWIQWAAVFATIAILSTAGIFIFKNQKVEAIRSIAVLPLEDISEGPKQEYFSAGMTEALIAELSKIGALRVISRTSAMRYRDSEKSVPEIAKELNIDALVEGSVIRDGNKVRVVAQLIGAFPERHIWAQTFDRDLDDLLSLYSEVAQEIANEIEIAITPQEKMRISDNSKVNPDAFEAYLKGKYHADNKSEHGLLTSLKYLQTAIELDSTFAEAYAWLAYTYVEIGNFGIQSSKDTYPKALEAAEKALILNDNLVFAHAVIGRVKMVYDYDWKSAEQAFQKALEINSNSELSMEWYADYLFATGKNNESLDLLKRSIDLDPFSTSSILHLGQFYLMNGQYDLAIEEINTVIELDPNFMFAYILLGAAYAEKGMFDEGIALVNKAENLSGGSNYLITMALGLIYMKSGETEKTLEHVRELESLSALNSTVTIWIAVIYAALDKKDLALLWLEKSYEERSNNLFLLNSYVEFESLKSEPEFINLRRKIGLDEQAN